MREQVFNRIVALTIIIFLLSMNFFPAISYAEFIRPGKAITPGQSIAPGEPIQGGQFIVPGQVYDPGDANLPGNSGVASGQPILPNSPFNSGIFLIPNVTPLQPGSLYGQLKGLEAGKGIQGGSNLSGGQGINAGQSAGSNEAINGGKGPNSNGKIESGQGPKAGQATNTGQATDAGNNPNGGQAVNSSKSQLGGTGKGEGDISSGGSSGTDEVPPWYNVVFKSIDSSKGIFGHLSGALGDFKTFGLGFLNQNVAGGMLSMQAGFKYEQIEGSTNYRVYGKNGYSNSLLDRLYQKYKNYSFNGEEKTLGPNSRRISEARLNAFLDSKKLKTTDKGAWSHISSSVKKAVNNSWNPFTKKIVNPKNWLSSSVINKDFFAKSNVLKLSGPVGYITTAAGSIYNYQWGAKKDIGLGSTDFAADLTTDIAIGVGSTAIGSIASSVAAGAVAGSAVPGLGTVVGAGAGLLAGLTTTYLINGTATGRRLKKAVSGGIKKAYDWIGGGIKKLGGLFG